MLHKLGTRNAVLRSHRDCLFQHLQTLAIILPTPATQTVLATILDLGLLRLG